MNCFSNLKMSDHGAVLQTYNQELVKCIEEMKIKKIKLQEVIDRQEAEKLILEKNIKSLQEKLNNVNGHITQHKALRDNYSAIIHDTETGFKKILESSQTLLNLAQHEAEKRRDLHETRTANC